MAKRKMTAKYRSKADAKRDAKRRKAKRKKGGHKEVEAVETVYLTSKTERLVFWILMITMIFAMLTHIALFFHEVRLVPRRYDQNDWAKFGERIERMAHFYSILAFGFALVLVILKWLPRSLAWHAYDGEWLSRLGGFGRKWATIPPAGRFNPEQKIATLALLLFGVLYVLSGVVQEMPGLIGENITLVRTSYSLHAFCLVALGFVALMHIYFGAFARPGGLGAIWSGRVPKKFAETHYGVWQEQSLESTKIKAEKERRRHGKFIEMEKERIAKIMAKRKMKSEAGQAAEEPEAMEMELMVESGEEVVELDAEVEDIEVAEEEEEYEYEEVEYEEGEEEEGKYDEKAFQEEVQDSEAFDLEPVEGEDEEGEEEQPG